MGKQAESSTDVAGHKRSKTQLAEAQLFVVDFDQAAISQDILRCIVRARRRNEKPAIQCETPMYPTQVLPVLVVLRCDQAQQHGLQSSMAI